MTNDEGILKKFFVLGNSYWLTRFVILRLLGFVYAVAFLVAVQQLVPLIGEHGLTPANHFLASVQTQLGSRTAGVLRVPSLFWFGISDHGLIIFAWTGFALSLVVFACYANAIILIALWAMYMSIVHIGQVWYGYGWETQLLETGFLSIFLCPLLDGRPFPKCRPPLLVIWLFRWLGFRIMIGAGLIKLRGDPCWRDLTCLYYHYETQPIPSPISRYLHFAPHWFHKFGTAWNHFIELIVPWFSFGPRHARHVAGILLVSFQIFLIISGNLSFLNYVTIIPFLACFDDTLLGRILPRPIVERAERAAQESEPSRINNTIAIALSVLVAYLSIAPVANLISERQMMNTSFDRRTTFVPDSIAIASHRLGIRTGGSASQSGNGYPRFPSMIRSSGASSKRWIGWIETRSEVVGQAFSPAGLGDPFGRQECLPYKLWASSWHRL